MSSVGQYHPSTMEIQFRWTDSDYVAAQMAWLIRHPRSLGRSLIPIAHAFLFGCGEYNSMNGTNAHNGASEVECT